MENVTTKSFGVGLERTFIGGFGLDSSLVDSDSTQVWWTRLEFGGLGLDSSIFKWTQTRLESQFQMTRLESFNGWTRFNTGTQCLYFKASELALWKKHGVHQDLL